MINPVAFTKSIESVISLVKELGIYKGKGVKGGRNHSEATKNAARKNKHTSLYNSAIQNLDYELLLYDDSIFQFLVSTKVLRYAFIQNPRNYGDRADFLISLYGDEELAQLEESALQDLENSITDEDYEQYLNEQEINLGANIIRYDFDSRGYKPLIHSCSHIHIGLNPNLRIPCALVLSPLKFALFTIKHTYYSQWEKAFNQIDKFEDRILACKRECARVPRAQWQPHEANELYLS